MKRYKGPEFLLYAGGLGHTCIVTCKDAERGERTYAETYPERAAVAYRELGDRAARISSTIAAAGRIVSTFRAGSAI